MIRKALGELGRLALLAGLLWAAMCAFGGLLTTAVDQTWPFSAEDDASRALAGSRTDALDAATAALTGVGDARTVVVATAVLALILRWRLRRWREPGFLVLAIAIQACVFALTTLVIHRERPAVQALDRAQFASSFPSAHASAAGALFISLALIVAWQVRHRLAKVSLITLLLAVPLLIGYSRLYRGMHYPTDVLAALASAFGSSLIAQRMVLGRWRLADDQPDALAAPGAHGGGQPQRAAVIYNPTKVPDFPGLKERVEAFMSGHGWQPPLWLETTRDDPGISACERAVEDKVDVVFVCGGDGTVMAAVTALAGRDMPLAILPAGTGNLLARNLGLPLDDEDASLRIGLGGHERLIDVAAVEGRKFAVMAGMGVDAAIMRDARPDLKEKMGWPAYVVSAGKHLRGQGWRVTVTLDDGTPMHRRVRSVVVGNVGKLQANIPLLPDAKPDDGLLDVVVLAPRGTLDWGRVVGRVVTGRMTRDRRVERFRCRHVLIETVQPQPRQLDGDLIPDGTSMDIQIEPLALRVRVRP